MNAPTPQLDELELTALRPFSASLPMALLRAREATMRLFRPLLARHGLTEQQWRVLRALSSERDAIDAGDLADRTFLLPPSLSRILVNLDERGMIDRRPDPADQRRTMIELTRTGRAIVERIAPDSERRYAAIEARFGSDRLAHLLDELAELAALDTEFAVEDAQRTRR